MLTALRAASCARWERCVACPASWPLRLHKVHADGCQARHAGLPNAGLALGGRVAERAGHGAAPHARHVRVPGEAGRRLLVLPRPVRLMRGMIRVYAGHDAARRGAPGRAGFRAPSSGAALDEQGRALRSAPLPCSPEVLLATCRLPALPPRSHHVHRRHSPEQKRQNPVNEQTQQAASGHARGLVSHDAHRRRARAGTLHPRPAA